VPLNRISSNLIPKARVESARRELADVDALFLAKDLVNYDRSKYETLMNYVFGSTMICSTSAIAQRVAFDEQLGLNAMAITLDGDIYNPAGILSGGDRIGNNRGASLLEIVAEMNQLEERLRHYNGKHRQELTRLEQDYVQQQNLQQHIDGLTSEMKLFELKLAQNDEHRLQIDIRTLEEQETTDRKLLDEQRRSQTLINSQIDELERLFRNEHEAKKKELAEIEQLTANGEKQIEQSEKRSREMQTTIKGRHRHRHISNDAARTSRVSDLQMQLDCQRTELDTVTSDMNVVRSSIDMSSQLLDEATNTLTSEQFELDELGRDLQTKRSRLTDYNNRIHALHRTEQELIRERRDIELQLEKNKHALVDLQTIVDESVRRRQLLIDKHGRWIDEEKEKFGIAGGQYDFSSMNIVKMQKDAKDDKEKVTKMSKHVDERAMTLLEQKRTMYKQVSSTADIRVLSRTRVDIDRIQLFIDRRQQGEFGLDAYRLVYPHVFSSLSLSLSRTRARTRTATKQTKEGLERQSQHRTCRRRMGQEETRGTSHRLATCE
jgi:structural maintenance of chromosome 2